MNEYSVLKTSRIIFIIGWIISGIFSYIYKDISIVLGLMVGYILSNITYYFLIRVVNLILEVENDKFFALCFIGNLLIYALGLFIAIKFPHILNVISVFCGYLLIKIAIYVETIIERRKKES